MNDWTQDDWTLLADCCRARAERLRSRQDMDSKGQVALLTDALKRIGTAGLTHATALSARHWQAVYAAILDAANRLSDANVSYSHASSLIAAKQLDRLLDLLGPDAVRLLQPGQPSQDERDLEDADKLLRFLRR